MLTAAVALTLFAGAQPSQREEPLPSTGSIDVRLLPFDELMHDFLGERDDVAGAALAIARDGRLVFARGYGYADRRSREPVQPDARFRIASLSKPITAAAVVLLAQEDELDLDDPALLHLDPGLLDGSLPLDSRWADVTLRRLLQHTAGFDRQLSGTPMFRSRRIARELGIPTPPEAQDVIRFYFGRSLDFDPGERYAYSNFGYSVLGRVIERSTEQDYESAVRELIVEPLGMQSLAVGRSLASQRLPGEVRYHTKIQGRSVFGERGELVPAPYGNWYHESLDAHGGWIASAPDLLRFASLFLTEGGVELLDDESRQSILGRPEHASNGESVWYGLGWQVRHLGSRGFNLWHTGLLPGCESLLVVRADGLAWAVLFNSSAEGGLAREIDPLLHLAEQEVQAWPRFDLFASPEPREGGAGR